jgi:hypothetical protein
MDCKPYGVGMGFHFVIILLGGGIRHRTPGDIRAIAKLDTSG